ncbi:MAG: formylglycine-generating enzyme family protein [Comamonadaceae bacterium]|nr:formylglycine-generating enzyme family protein [Comamonadaceae bacterium]
MGVLTVALLLSACSSWSPWTSSQTVVNTLGMQMVRIPAGEFLMGKQFSVDEMTRDFPAIERSRLDALTDEYPVHAVQISKPFLMARHELTVGQFRLFLASSGYVPESVADGTGGYGYRRDYDPASSARGDAFEGRDPRYSWQNPGFPQSEDHPVTNVTWNDAQALADWLTRTEGVRYRLPTEAEWEYACRAGSTGHYPHGNDVGQLARTANTFDVSAAALWPQWQSVAAPGDDGFPFTAPVGSFPPNAFGLHDMVGNVWEWVSDLHSDDYYAQSPHQDPPGPTEGSVRVRRGGSWHTWPVYARCGFRNWNTASTRYTLVGIRLVRELKANEH